MALEKIKSKDATIYFALTAEFLDDDNETATGTFFASHAPIKKKPKKTKKK